MNSLPTPAKPTAGLTRGPQTAARRAAVVAILLLAAWLLHRPALYGLARLLVTESATDGEMIWIRSNDGIHGSGQNCYDVAAELYRRGPARRIVLVAWHPQRVVELGIIPSFEVLSRHELARCHVPEEAISVVPGGACDSWQEVRALDRWLAGQPEAHVTAIAQRFDSRLLQVMLRSVDRRLPARVGILALGEREFDESNWWKDRDGAKVVSFALVELAYAWCRGEGRPLPAPPSADGYEQAYLKRLIEVGR